MRFTTRPSNGCGRVIPSVATRVTVPTWANEKPASATSTGYTMGRKLETSSIPRCPAAANSDIATMAREPARADVVSASATGTVEGGIAACLRAWRVRCNRALRPRSRDARDNARRLCRWPPTRVD